MNQLTKRILITIIIFIIYRLGYLIDPGLMIQKTGLLALMTQMFQYNYSLFSLGFSSALSGFLVVEIIFIVIPALRKIRNSGYVGRKIMTLWSLVVSFLIAVLQAFNLVKMLLMSRDSINFPLVADYPFMANLSYSLFYIAGFAIVLFLGLLISRYGIGNGFCILIVGDIVIKTISMIKASINVTVDRNLDPNYIGYIILVAISYLIFHLLTKKDTTINIKNQTYTSFNLPFLLQGAGLLYLGAAFITLLPLDRLGINLVKIATRGSWTFSIYIAFETIILSLLGYWIFSSKARISSNLSIPQDSIEINHKPLIKSILLLSFLSVLFMIPFPMWNQKFIPTIISFPQLFVLIAILIDLYKEGRFINTHKTYISLCTLDNVHFASLLKDKLNEQGINHYIQGYQYRRLLFFLQPFIKMNVLIPIPDQGKAQEIFNAYQINYL